ncbi:AfsR/SARP family transcriptional regulator [Streptomyces sp. NPDC004822]
MPTNWQPGRAHPPSAHDESTQQIRFALLGPVRAWLDGQEVDLGSPQQRAVAVTLLLRHGRSVAVDQLVDAVWGEDPSTGAVSTVRTYVSRLRRTLEPERAVGQPAQVVLSVAGGYMLQCGPDAIDVAEFEARVAEGRRFDDRGMLREASHSLAAALDLWRGVALGGVPGPLAEAERSRLTERRMSVLEARLDLDLRLGRHDDAVAELAALCTRHPLRERLWALLILGLYRCGRRADALRSYQNARDILIEELGMEPGRELQLLHSRILDEDSTLAFAADEDGFSPDVQGSKAARGPHTTEDADGAVAAEGHGVQTASSSAIEPRQLPADLPAFVGRDDEIGALSSLLTRPGKAMVAAISGMAGVGKTALAVHLAHTVADRFPDGQLYINLRGFDPAGTAVESSTAIQSLLVGLGIDPQQVPPHADAQAALYRSVLANRQLLIVLDNAKNSDHVRPLLPGAPGCLVLVTSRDRLTGLVASHQALPLALDVLDEGKAFDFLAERIGGDRTAAEPHAVDTIIRHCARLPLALALVAAHATTHPSYPLTLLAQELEDTQGSLDGFESSDATLDVRAVFSWSYQALTSPAARLFRLLALHPGPVIGAESAAGIAGLHPRQARPLLAELTHAHLLSEPAPRSYVLHDLVRHYASELVAEIDSPDSVRAARHRMLDHYLHTAHSVGALYPGSAAFDLHPPVEGSWPLTLKTTVQADLWVKSEYPVLLALVDLAACEGFTSHCWQLALSLRLFEQRFCAWQDFEQALRTGLAASEQAQDLTGQAHMHRMLGRLLAFGDEPGLAQRHLIHALHLHLAQGDLAGQGETFNLLSFHAMRGGDHETAIVHALRALDVNRRHRGRDVEARDLGNVGYLYAERGCYDQALSYCRMALQLLQDLGDVPAQAPTWDSLGYIYARSGDHEKAIEAYENALQLVRRRGDRWDEAQILVNLGQVHRDFRQGDLARAKWEEALTILEELGRPETEEVRAQLDDLAEGA